MRHAIRLALLSFAAAAPLAAQTRLPETVVTATRVPTPAERLPAATTVIDRRTIEERGYTTLADALAAVPGITIVPTGGFGQQASVFVRGSNSRHVLVLLDGQPINDPSEANGAFNFGDEALADIERIEVVRGPASVYYGSAAVGGVINLITRRAPRDRTFAPFGEVALGTDRTLLTTAGAGGTLRDSRLGLFDYMATAQAVSTRGSNVTAGRISPGIGEEDGGRLAAFTARLGYEPTPGTRLEAFARRRETRIGLDDRPSGGGFDDPNYGALNRRTTARLSGQTTLFDGFWTTGVSAGYGEDRRKFTNDPDPLNTARARDTYMAEQRRFEWTNTLRPALGGPLSDSAVIFGIQRQDEEVDAANGSAGFRTTTRARNGSTGGYLGAQARLFSLLDLTTGIRREEDEDFGANTTWNVGGVLAVPGLPLPLRLRAAYGTSFKAPSLFQRFGTIPGFFTGNANLKPEKGDSWEAGIEADFATPGGTSTLAVTYFESRIRDLIDFNAAFDTVENRDRARISGVETALTLRPVRWLEAVASFTWLDARDDRSDARLARRPAHSGAASLRIMPFEAVVVTPEITYAGNHREGAFATYLDDSSSLNRAANTKGATLVNLTATWALDPRFTLYATGRNLTDRAYEPANSFQVAGRTVLAGVRARW